jgi:hypothetical protein
VAAPAAAAGRVVPRPPRGGPDQAGTLAAVAFPCEGSSHLHLTPSLFKH